MLIAMALQTFLFCCVCAKAEIRSLRAFQSSRSYQMVLYSSTPESFVSSEQNNLNRGKHTCPQCFMLKILCICERVKAIQTASISDKVSEVLLITHHKELGRASNSGKLLTMMHPHKCKVHIYQPRNLPEQYDFPPSTQQSLVSNDQTTLLLYPETSGGEKFNSEPISNFAGQKGLRLCVIDSTWPQSKKMNEKLPRSILRVHINDLVEGPSLFLSRKQNCGGEKIGSRVSTLEATALGLLALGEDKETVISPLMQALRLSVDAVLMQSGKKRVFGNNISPIPTEEFLDPTYNGPFKRAVVIRPSHCLNCGLESREARLKNRGTKPPTETHPLMRCWYCKSCKSFFYTPSLEGESHQVV